jgi:hypothetical protein
MSFPANQIRRNLGGEIANPPYVFGNLGWQSLLSASQRNEFAPGKFVAKTSQVLIRQPFSSFPWLAALVLHHFHSKTNPVWTGPTLGPGDLSIPLAEKDGGR